MSLRQALPFVSLFVVAAAGATPVSAQLAVPQEVLQSSHYLHWHPDLRYRRDGFHAWERGAFDEAARRFRRAAEFGDKPSQAMVGEMLWKGQGIPQDRALGYAWMDLAAERGYPTFVGFRESYWAAMTPAERMRAVTEGQQIYARYGDAVAKERMAHQLRKGRMHFTGSRASSMAPRALTVWLPTASGGMAPWIGETVYQKRMWATTEYFEWQDQILGQPLIPRVEVLPLVEDAPPPTRGD